MNSPTPAECLADAAEAIRQAETQLHQSSHLREAIEKLGVAAGKLAGDAEADAKLLADEVKDVRTRVRALAEEAQDIRVRVTALGTRQNP
jgi:aspartyl/asparaginyl beta-hydroxylase (cupin superfamily)